MGRFAAVVAAVTLVLTACGSDDDSANNPTSTTSAVTTTEAPETDPLVGTWTTEPVTCEQQQAAVDRAGFTPEQQDLGGWECYPEVVTLRFQDGALVIFESDEVGWEGVYALGEDGTFTAGGDLEDAGLYISYTYTLDGDELVIDMVRDEAPAASEGELLGEQMAQTRIYESVPFSRAE